ncbi:MAG: DsbA family protein [Geobacteraceae bacterium]|nr:DsbA family protein [Geobacteraceae bacterium]
MNHNPKLEVFFDYICPWCYLNTVSIDRVQKEYGIVVDWKAFLLYPEIPEKGIELSELFPGQNPNSGSGKDRMRSTAEELGLPLVENRKTVSNSRRAHELGKWAESMGKGDLFRKTVFHAYFSEGHNIAQLAELKNIARTAGLPADQVTLVLEKGLFAESVDSDWHMSEKLGIVGVPFVICEEGALAGFHPAEDYIKLLGK